MIRMGGGSAAASVPSLVVNVTACPRPPLDTRMLLTAQAALVFKTTAPPLHRAEVEGVAHVGVDFGSPAAARAINAAGRAVAHEAGIMVLDAEVGGEVP